MVILTTGGRRMGKATLVKMLLLGESPIVAAARDIASSDAMAAQQLSFYLNQARPSTVLSTEMILDKDQVTALRDRWNSGGTPMILTAGLKSTKKRTSMSYPKYKGKEIAFSEFIIKDDTYALFDPDDKLVAKLKRHEYLSQPQLKRLGNSHGRYRKSHSPLRGHTARQPGSPTSIGTLIYPSTITFVAFRPEDGPVEDAGIRAGEVEACRCWWVVDDMLRSIYMTYYEWKPNEPMTGNIYAGHGVHAFKDECDLFDYACSVWLSNNPLSSHKIVIGKISMWGGIVEHQRGYRAEYAKIISLNTSDEKLRRKYGV